MYEPEEQVHLLLESGSLFHQKPLERKDSSEAGKLTFGLKSNLKSLDFFLQDLDSCFGLLVYALKGTHQTARFRMEPSINVPCWLLPPFWPVLL